MHDSPSEKRKVILPVSVICVLFSTVVFFMMAVSYALPCAWAQETQGQDAQEMQTAAQDSPKEGDEVQEDAEAGEPVELNGDTVEYSVDGNKVIAEGNVIVIHKNMRLTCDRIEFARDTSMAYATGNVRLVSAQQGISEMTGQNLTFNFKNMEGSFDGAKIFAKPYFGYGKKVFKVGENHIRMEDNYVTTCDLDKPHYRMASKRMDMYPGDKLVARSVRMLVGKVPLFWLPRMTKDISNKRPKVIYTPGYDKEWGMFLLTQWLYELSPNFKGAIRFDAREKKDLAGGLDVKYKTKGFGEGKIRTYYMNERSITSKRFYQLRPEPTIERERFKVEWRHKWEIDQKTDAIMQYYKLSDSTMLKDYFEQEHEEDSSPSTYFLLTRTIPTGALSFRTDARVNRFESAVERLPEVRYQMSNKPLFGTGFYLQNTTTYSNLTKKTASPSEVRQNTMRVDMDSQLSYPLEIGFIDFTPNVGGRHTYYTKTKDPTEYHSIRGIFETGANVSTRFFRIFDVHVDKFGLEINRLRHIVQPSVAYTFRSDPTLSSSELDFFDSVDSIDNAHGMTFSLENKLQTKRNNKTVDLLRAIISSDFNLKDDPGKGGFGTVSADIDFRPVDWVTFYFDSTYDTQKEYLTTANFDISVNAGGKWTADIGKRWNREVDDQLTTQLTYNINPKWAVQAYNRFDLRNGILKEQQYTVTRDLHAWKMDINFNETRSEGDEIWIVFTLKAFPDMAIDFGSSFNKRKAGSQSSEGD